MIEWQQDSCPLKTGNARPHTLPESLPSYAPRNTLRLAKSPRAESFGLNNGWRKRVGSNPRQPSNACNTVPTRSREARELACAEARWREIAVRIVSGQASESTCGGRRPALLAADDLRLPRPELRGKRALVRPRVVQPDVWVVRPQQVRDGRAIDPARAQRER